MLKVPPILSALDRTPTLGQRSKEPIEARHLGVSGAPAPHRATFSRPRAAVSTSAGIARAANSFANVSRCCRASTSAG